MRTVNVLTVTSVDAKEVVNTVVTVVGSVTRWVTTLTDTDVTVLVTVPTTTVVTDASVTEVGIGGGVLAVFTVSVIVLDELMVIVKVTMVWVTGVVRVTTVRVSNVVVRTTVVLVRVSVTCCCKSSILWR